MTSKREFEVEQLIDWEVEYDNVLSKEVDSGRWTRTDEHIFRAPDDELYYRVITESGLTEYQELDTRDRFPDSTTNADGKLVVACVQMEWRTETKPVTSWFEVA